MNTNMLAVENKSLFSISRKLMLSVAFGMAILLPALAYTWTDTKGVAWTYTVTDGYAFVGGGNYSADRAVPSLDRKSVV